MATYMKLPYRLIDRKSGNSPWAFPTEEEARAFAEDAGLGKEPDDLWALVRLGDGPEDNVIVATYPPYR